VALPYPTGFVQLWITCTLRVPGGSRTLLCGRAG